ncbi:WAT1-related protein At1g25270 [Ricinus communis]|uniref:WAT1-related protein At1g25270 n=1 Tax=Ricinus communis TaxID=3988 RepID=UPI00201AADFC|nr:WAT1-related protein At1g25270 [Ricinus communis]
MRQNVEVLHGLKPVMLMLVVQIVYAGMNILYKLAANDGMNLRVLVVYRYIFSTAFIVPLALIVERKSRPKLTWAVLSQAFLCGFFGVLLPQNLYLEGLALTSATFVVAMSNLIPAFTLILAVLFRLDKLELITQIGRAKVLGILTGIAGAMILTFYKGAEINIWSTNIHLLKHNHQHQNSHTGNRPILGSSLTLASCISFALWLNIQAKLSKRYPCPYSSTALVSVMGLIQCLTLSACMERNWKQWILGWNIRLLTATYGGIASSGLTGILIVWCLHIRGPVFATSFSPVALVLVAIMGSFILGEKLHLGSILGAVVILCGLYMLLWGQTEEIKEKAKLVSILEEVVTSVDQPAIATSTHEKALPK